MIDFQNDDRFIIVNESFYNKSFSLENKYQIFQNSGQNKTNLVIKMIVNKHPLITNKKDLQLDQKFWRGEVSSSDCLQFYLEVNQNSLLITRIFQTKLSHESNTFYQDLRFLINSLLNLEA